MLNFCIGQCYYLQCGTVWPLFSSYWQILQQIQHRMNHEFVFSEFIILADVSNESKIDFMQMKRFSPLIYLARLRPIRHSIFTRKSNFIHLIVWNVEQKRFVLRMSFIITRDGKSQYNFWSYAKSVATYWVLTVLRQKTEETRRNRLGWEFLMYFIADAGAGIRVSCVLVVYLDLRSGFFLSRFFSSHNRLRNRASNFIWCGE